MENVKLPKEVAESIEQIRADYKVGREYDLEFIRKENFPYMRPVIEFTTDSNDHMLQYFIALVNGYEVEETPEDKVREVLVRFFKSDAIPKWVIREINEIYEGVNT